MRYVGKAGEDGDEELLVGDEVADGFEEDMEVTGVGGGGGICEGETGAVGDHCETGQGFRGRYGRKCHV